MSYDVERVRKEFPILERQVHGLPLVYLDNAATSQKPRAVLEAIQQYYASTNANIHRGVHLLSVEATAAHDAARRKLAGFVGAAAPEEIIFVRGTTEAINLVAQSFVRPRVKPGDEILISHLEHHSNIVPWQLVCGQTGAVLRVARIDERGAIDLEHFHSLLGPRTRFVALAHVSNALGTINPVQEMIGAAHARGVPVLLDGAQGVPHMRIDVQALGCDFYAFSGHKMYGPTGIGVLHGRAELLESMDPYQGGGDMIRSVSFEQTTYNTLPYRFEAGTPDIAGAIALGAAVDFMQSLGADAIGAHEATLVELATRQLSAIPGIRLIGTAPHKAAVVSFVMDGVHPHDVGTILDREGIAVRTGHHCAQPVMDRFDVPATTRASFAAYNTPAEVERLVEGLARVRELFGS
jgi:cysteine desulfurase / selenocysteine lyase